MEKIKTILDRKPLSSEYIKTKQDFGKVMKGTQNLNAPVWKSAWFYGTVGVATVAIVATAVTLGGAEGSVDNNPTKEKVVAGNALGESDKPQSENNTYVADLSASEPKNDSEHAKKDVKPVEQPKTATNQKTDPKETTKITAKEIEKAKEEAKSATELGVPNIAGISSGPISYKDFCNPMGLQVSNGLIYEYTIQYRSCARDVTATIRGNKIPGSLCQEIYDCGNNIEISFLNIKTQNKEGQAVMLKNFSVVTTL